MLNLERLRVLHAISVTGSVIGAARALQVTTSAVSQQIARLQREVGQRLVERQGRGIRLTDAGVLLAQGAGELLTHAERIESGLAAHCGEVSGTMTIAAFATAARGLLPAALGALRTGYPDLVISLHEQEPHESIPALVRGQLDIAVVQDWIEDPLTVPDSLSRLAVLDDPFDIALPASHPLALRESVAITELAEQEWISWTAGQICHDWLSRTLHAHGIEPRVVHTAAEHSTQLALVGAGLGAAVIPRLGREPVPETVRFVPLTPAPVRRVFALWRQSVGSRPATRATLGALRSADDVVEL